MTDVPKKLGFAMPAEWEEHSAIWLAWPHDKISFGSLNQPKGKTDTKLLPKVEKKFVEIITAIHTGEPVELLVLDEKMKSKAEKLFQKAGIDLSKITFHITDYADIWLRDYGPMFINNPVTHEQAWIKWSYNAYGSKFPQLLKDNEVFFHLRGVIDKRMFEPGLVMECGAIETNGSGVLLTTEQCLLNSNRNPGLNKAALEKILIDNTGAHKIIWLKKGLVNDHTDGHIDEIVRFISEDTIMCAYEGNEDDPNFKILDDNYHALEKATDQNGKPFKLVKLPMPHMKYKDGEIAPVSYTNFYIGNEVVLAATFNDANDEKALKIIQDCLPKHKVIGLDCSDIIYGGGAIHCMTQQVPDLS